MLGTPEFSTLTTDRLSGFADSEDNLQEIVSLHLEVDAVINQMEFKKRKIEYLTIEKIISCTSHMPVAEVVSIMYRMQVSFLFIRNSSGDIVGFVTGLMIRNFLSEQEADTHLPIICLSEASLAVVDKQASVQEGIQMLMQTRSPYLLVEEDGKYLGMVHRNQLFDQQQQSPFMLVQTAKQATSVWELKVVWEQVSKMVFQLLSKGTHADVVNQLMATISDIMVQKVINEVLEQMGPAPAKFVFMTLGSVGRQEQTLKTDQDNAIIYEDKANEKRELVRAYFLKFAKQVSEHLHYIGFTFCSGGFMASNPKWTHSLSHWKRNYTRWIQEAVPETVINIATFFDCRFVYGEQSIMDELKLHLDQELQKPLEKFMFYMGKNALQYEPPKTFFGSFKTIKKGENKVINLKKVMAPIVDLVRVFALKNRIFKTNTGERLQELREKGIFTQQEFQELWVAYYYLMGLRLKSQASQLINEQAEPDNYLSPKSLTNIEQVTLKEIFKTIENFQLKIKVNFTGSLFG